LLPKSGKKTCFILYIALWDERLKCLFDYHLSACLFNFTSADGIFRDMQLCIFGPKISWDNAADINKAQMSPQGL